MAFASLWPPAPSFPSHWDMPIAACPKPSVRQRNTTANTQDVFPVRSLDVGNGSPPPQHLPPSAKPTLPSIDYVMTREEWERLMSHWKLEQRQHLALRTSTVGISDPLAELETGYLPSPAHNPVPGCHPNLRGPSRSLPMPSPTSSPSLYSASVESCPISPTHASASTTFNRQPHSDFAEPAEMDGQSSQSPFVMEGSPSQTISWRKSGRQKAGGKISRHPLRETGRTSLRSKTRKIWTDFEKNALQEYCHELLSSSKFRSARKLPADPAIWEEAEEVLRARYPNHFHRTRHGIMEMARKLDMREGTRQQTSIRKVAKEIGHFRAAP